MVDHEICGMAQRLMQGIEPRDDFPSAPRFEEMLAEGHLLISDHTRRHLRTEHYFPSPVIDRANRSRWQEEGRLTLGQRAQREVARRLAAYEPTDLPETTRTRLTELMTREAARFGMDTLPSQDV